MTKSLWIVLTLSAVMIATRFGHMGTAWSLPDASWALFFAGGFYLSLQWRWALPWLVMLAVGIDLIAIGHFGVSNYCVTVAYAFNLPAYALLWLAGRWLRRHQRYEALDLVRLVLSALIGVSVCFLITNGSFYWLGGRVSERTFSGWTSNFFVWYLPYLDSAFIYIAIAGLLQLTLEFHSRVARPVK